jgi:alkylation response protein AidB-like acyl-CoA dehydrogenase
MTPFSLTDDHKDLRKGILSFCQSELSEGAEERDRAGTFSRDLWDKCGEMGLQGLPVPAEQGGLGLDGLSCAVALEALGLGCPDGGLLMSISAHLLANVVPIWKHGSKAQHERHLADLCSGRSICAVGMTESNAGSDPYSMSTKAVPDGDGWVITGRKTLISNSSVADLALIYARTEEGKGYHGGITAFLLEHPQFERGQAFETMGLRTCPIGELVLDDVRVGPEAVVGSVGAGGPMFFESMNWERTLLVACHVGVMERLLNKAIRYARTRKSGGVAIGKHQAVSHRIADMKVKLEAARLLTYKAASKLGRSHDVALDAAIAKLFVSESLVSCALDTIRTLGGYGYTAEYEVERAMRDAVGGILYSGTSDIQRVLIARWLLGI